MGLTHTLGEVKLRESLNLLLNVASDATHRVVLQKTTPPVIVTMQEEVRLKRLNIGEPPEGV